MHIIVDTKQLLSGIKVLKSIGSDKSWQYGIDGIMLKVACEGNSADITRTNGGETTINTVTTCRAFRVGHALVNINMLALILRQFSGEVSIESVTVDADGFGSKPKVKISQGDTVYYLPRLNSAPYPIINTMGQKAVFDIQEGVLVDILSRLGKMVSVSKDRRVLHNIKMLIKPKSVVFAATNAAMVGEITYRTHTHVGEDVEVLLSKDMCKAIMAGTTKKTKDSQCHIRKGDTHVEVSIGSTNTKVISSCVSDRQWNYGATIKYPEYERAFHLEKDMYAKVTISRDSLLSMCRKAAIISSRKDDPKMNIRVGRDGIVAVSDNAHGTLTQNANATCNTEDLIGYTCAVNPKYLYNIASAVQDDMVDIWCDLAYAHSGIIIKGCQKADEKYLLMPLRANTIHEYVEAVDAET